MRILILSFFLLSLFTSCSKNVETNDSIPTGVRWNLVSTSGTITGQGISTDWDAIEFVSDDEVAFFKESKKLLSAGYSFKTVAGITRITFNFVDNALTNPVVDLKGDNIKIYEYDSKDNMRFNADCCDRVNYQLKRA